MVERREGTTPEAQLALLDPPPAAPVLTERQAFALRLVEEAGSDGVHGDEIGAAWCAQRGKHHIDTRCHFDGSNGKQILEALKKKGLVRYKRGRDGIAGVWLLAGASDNRPTRVPYGAFPEGF